MDTIIREQKYDAPLHTGKNFLLTQMLDEFHIDEISNHTGQCIGRILHFNERVTARKTTLKTRERNTLFLIPLEGSIKVSFAGRQEIVVRKENIYVMLPGADDEITISGSQSSESVRYLQIAMKCDAAVYLEPSMFPVNFDALPYNRLSNIFSYGSLSILYSFRKISVGRFNIGSNLLYHVMHKQINKCLVYAIEGYFQIDGRRLSPGCVLSLWNITHFIIECLSDTAAILILEYNGVLGSNLAVQ